MQKMAVWINIKASKLGQSFFLLTYAGLILIVFMHNFWLTNGLIPFILLQGWWSWRKNFGVTAPVALLIKNNQLFCKLASGRLQLLQPPAVLFSRFTLVFKPVGLLAWPWFLWPDAISRNEHHQLRYFLRAWY